MARFEAGMESMVDVYIFETTSLLEQLDEILMRAENNSSMEKEDINEIFRIMHTIKGSSAMMGLENMSVLAHRIEDLFFIFRENNDIQYDMRSLFDIVFRVSDSLKSEIELVQGDTEPTDFSPLISDIKDYIEILKNGGKAPEKAAPNAEKAKKAKPEEKDDDDMTVVKVMFEDGCMMENLRAMMLLNGIRDNCEKIEYIPADIETNPETAAQIIEEGFIIKFKPAGKAQDVINGIENALNVKSYEIIEKQEKAPAKPAAKKGTKADTKPVTKEEAVAETVAEAGKIEAASQAEQANTAQSNNAAKAPAKQSIISVNLNKLDKLLDMVGEIVITESMVISSPDIKDLKLENFQKAARQLRKLTDELQDVVMSIRMVPVSGAFSKMSRIVRDMKVKLNKDVDLVFEGEETEVDKSVIDVLNDPLMHLIRNAMDHGIETPEEYAESGKTEKSRIKLSAFNSSGEVVIIISDNGKGINPQKVLAKAKERGLLTKPESAYSTKEICNLIMAPGFSMKEQVTEFSGRGVGTDVVKKNIESVGGTVTVDSKFGEGTSFIIRIPLSLAIVEGMQVSVGESTFLIPISSIKESFKFEDKQLLNDSQTGEMIMLRGKCYPLIRLHNLYNIKPNYTELKDGIIVLVQAEGNRTCLFVDELIGEQQVVVKPFSPLLNRFEIKQKGMSGCSILGDGSITIILDVNSIINDF